MWSVTSYPIGLGGQDEIAFRQTVNLVGPDSQGDSSPSERDFRMVSFFLRDLSHRIGEIEGLTEIQKLEAFSR